MADTTTTELTEVALLLIELAEALEEQEQGPTQPEPDPTVAIVKLQLAQQPSQPPSLAQPYTVVKKVVYDENDKIIEVHEEHTP